MSGVEKKAPTPRELRVALSGAWDYSQAQSYVKELRARLGAAWDYMTPAIREAFVAERAFAVIRARHGATVEVRDMDKLLSAMLVAAGLAELGDVT